MPAEPEDPDECPIGDLLEPVTEWPTIEVEITEPTVTGQLLGPDGSVLVTVYDRTVVPFGFQIPPPVS